MRRVFKTFAFAAAVAVAACSGKPGYVITGTVETGADGDMVFLQERQGWNFVNLDTAVVSAGQFTFEGVQELPKNVYLSCKTAENNVLRTDFFLENGKLTVELKKENPSVKGTAVNDAYQAVKDQIAEVYPKMRELSMAARQEGLSEGQRDSIYAEYEKLDNRMSEINLNAAKANITNAVGVHLLKSIYYGLKVDELDALLSQVPESFKSDETVVKIQKYANALKTTAVGQKFVDFTMKDLEGKDVKLSDYVGKGKVVVVDFWASWCGPCRAGMPALKELYKKYKGDKFEIVGVSLDKEEAAWKKGIEDLGINWPHMSDLKYWDCEGAQLYGVNAIPHLVVMDKDGVIAARNIHGAELEAKVKELIAK